jgi:hypothetical protein
MAIAAKEVTNGVRNVTRGDSEGGKKAVPEVTQESKKTALKTALCPCA